MYFTPHHISQERKKTMAFSKNHSFLFMLFPILFILVTMQFAFAFLFKTCYKGVISLGPGDSFDFRFRVNLRKTTVYTCNFAWLGNTATFDIFRADRDDNPRSKVGVCSECILSIYEPAPYRDRRDGGQPNCFQWAS
ncbi:BnaA09g13670D [Brassica napus]|uniref:(rape) hypothetical protein n=1 Tax=Brassica napus TaxID=3708 RepID=A0A078FIV3_BRANA|nr:unnamed protein product [Brassica napus]CDY12907.1 BnaA09g13670D [Brassica napus]